MKPLAALLIGACIAAIGAAFAQQGGAPASITPEYETRPTTDELMSNLPRRLLRQNRSGVAVLCCDVREDRRLDCAVNAEWPEASGFGHAARRVARYYRLTPQSQAEFMARPGVKVRLVQSWRGVEPDSAELAEIARISRETAAACLPPLESTE